LNRLGVDHECDGRTDGQKEPPLAIARSTDRRLKDVARRVTTANFRRHYSSFESRQRV